jgi:hypothetical protein
MMIDGGTVIVLVYLLVSVGVIVAFVLIFAGGLEWFADRLRERRRSQRVHQPATYYNEVRTLAWEGHALHTPDREVRRHCCVSDPRRATPLICTNLDFGSDS